MKVGIFRLKERASVNGTIIERKIIKKEINAEIPYILRLQIKMYVEVRQVVLYFQDEVIEFIGTVLIAPELDGQWFYRRPIGCIIIVVTIENIFIKMEGDEVGVEPCVPDASQFNLMYLTVTAELEIHHPIVLRMCP